MKYSISSSSLIAYFSSIYAGFWYPQEKHAYVKVESNYSFGFNLKVIPSQGGQLDIDQMDTKYFEEIKRVCGGKKIEIANFLDEIEKPTKDVFGNKIDAQEIIDQLKNAMDLGKVSIDIDPVLHNL